MSRGLVIGTLILGVAMAVASLLSCILPLYEISASALMITLKLAMRARGIELSAKAGPFGIASAEIDWGRDNLEVKALYNTTTGLMITVCILAFICMFVSVVFMMPRKLASKPRLVFRLLASGVGVSAVICLLGSAALINFSANHSKSLRSDFVGWYEKPSHLDTKWTDLLEYHPELSSIRASLGPLSVPSHKHGSTPRPTHTPSPHNGVKIDVPPAWKQVFPCSGDSNSHSVDPRSPSYNQWCKTFRGSAGLVSGSRSGSESGILGGDMKWKPGSAFTCLIFVVLSSAIYASLLGYLWHKIHHTGSYEQLDSLQPRRRAVPVVAAQPMRVMRTGPAPMMVAHPPAQYVMQPSVYPGYPGYPQHYAGHPPPHSYPPYPPQHAAPGYYPAAQPYPPQPQDYPHPPPGDAAPPQATPPPPFEEPSSPSDLPPHEFTNVQ